MPQMHAHPTSASLFLGHHYAQTAGFFLQTRISVKAVECFQHTVLVALLFGLTGDLVVIVKL